MNFQSALQIALDKATKEAFCHPVGCRGSFPEDRNCETLECCRTSPKSTGPVEAPRKRGQCKAAVAENVKHVRKWPIQPLTFSDHLRAVQESFTTVQKSGHIRPRQKSAQISSLKSAPDCHVCSAVKRFWFSLAHPFLSFRSPSRWPMRSGYIDVSWGSDCLRL